MVTTAAFRGLVRDTPARIRPASARKGNDLKKYIFGGLAAIAAALGIFAAAPAQASPIGYATPDVLGYLAVIGGMKLGGQAKASSRLVWLTKIHQALPKSARARLVFGVYEEKRTQ